MPILNDEYLDLTGLSYFKNRLDNEFPSQTDFDTLEDKVDEIIAEGGEPNVIEVVKVNNTPLTPDANKAVNVTVPEDLSDLTNTGNDPYATESYVDQNGGKIQKIKVNGVEETIDPTDKSVDIDVPTSSSDLSDGSTIAHASDLPTKVSDLTNDSGFQNSSDVSSAINTALANGNDPYTTESDVDSKIQTAITAVYKYKGSVATYADLPSSGNTTGDVWDVQATGLNYAWDGTGWDPLGQYVDTSLFWAKADLVAITTAQIDALFA